jgi:hypothetical protein
MNARLDREIHRLTRMEHAHDDLLAPRSPPAADPARDRPLEPRSAFPVGRVLELVRAGHLSRAARTLVSNGVAPADADTTRRLQDLHPPLDPASRIPLPPADSPRFTAVTNGTLKTVIIKMADGASAGPSGWTAEMLLALVDDPECLRGLAAVVEDILSCDLDARVRRLLLSCVMIALRKSRTGDAVRPVAIGDLGPGLDIT